LRAGGRLLVRVEDHTAELTAVGGKHDVERDCARTRDRKPTGKNVRLAGPDAFDIEAAGRGRDSDVVAKNIGVQYNLGWATVAGTSTNGANTSSATIQAAHTDFIDIQVLTPGADYLTASGLRYDYSESAVPEPSMRWLLIIGIAACWKWNRRLSVRSS